MVGAVDCGRLSVGSSKWQGVGLAWPAWVEAVVWVNTVGSLVQVENCRWLWWLLVAFVAVAVVVVVVEIVKAVEAWTH